MVKVDLETGLPATGDEKETIWEAFSDGNFPFPAEKTGPQKEGASSGETPKRILPEGKVDGP
jgi:hypothetical protein